MIPAEGGRPERVVNGAANPTWAQDDRGLVMYFDAKVEGRPQVYWTKVQ